MLLAMSGQSQGRRREAVVATVLIGAAFMGGLDLFIVNVAFDEIARDLAGPGGSTTLADVSWVLTAYAVVYAALLVPLGRLSDRYGRRTGFVLGLSVFTAASAACGFAGDVWTLVALRALQAVGAAAMTPASLGLLLAALPATRRPAAARTWALASAVAAALGPAVGGGLVEASWRWAFWVNVPVGIALVVVALRVVPDVRHDDDAPRPDLVGALALAVGVGAVVLGLVEGDAWGWASAGVLGSWAVAVVALAAFAVLSARHASPLVDPALLRIREFASSCVTTVVFNTAFAGGLLGGILWMQQVWGYSALGAGLAVALGPLVVPVTSVLVHRALPTVRPAALVVAGCAVGAAGSVALALSLDPGGSYWTSLAPGWVVVGVGVGLAMPNLVASATTPLPAHQVSTGSGVVNMARQVGLALGVSVLVGVVGSGPVDPDRLRLALGVVAATYAVAGAVGLLGLTGPSGRGAARRRDQDASPSLTSSTTS